MDREAVAVGAPVLNRFTSFDAPDLRVVIEPYCGAVREQVEYSRGSPADVGVCVERRDVADERAWCEHVILVEVADQLTARGRQCQVAGDGLAAVAVSAVADPWLCSE